MRAIKIFMATFSASFILTAFADSTLTCISNGGFQRCDLSQADKRDIRIQHVKAGNCDMDNSWGVDSSGIWVDKGCGAIFEYTSAATAQTYEGDDWPDVVVGAGFLAPFYGPGYYYGAGYYNNNWHNGDYCDHNNCNHNQQHYNENAHHEESHPQNFQHYEGGGFHGGGFHGGGGRR